MLYPWNPFLSFLYFKIFPNDLQSRVRRNTIKARTNVLHCTKSVRIRSYSCPYFPALWLNTERYFVSLRIQYECGKIRARITPNTDIFHAVLSAEVHLKPCKTSMKELWWWKVIHQFFQESYVVKNTKLRWPKSVTFFYKSQLLSTNHFLQSCNFFYNLANFFYKWQLFSPNMQLFFYKWQLFYTILQLFSANDNFFLQPCNFFYK